MLKDRIKKHMEEGGIIYEAEKQYIEKHQLTDNFNNVKIMDSRTRFEDAYIERCDKQTEDTIKKESASFLKQPINFLKQQKQEFIYMESDWYDLIGVDAVSLESDDVFGTYDVMLGLKLQKKYDNVLRNILNKSLQGDEAKFDLMFSQEDGLWDLNFAFNFLEGFQEDMMIGEAYELIYEFLLQLVDTVEEGNG